MLAIPWQLPMLGRSGMMILAQPVFDVEIYLAATFVQAQCFENRKANPPANAAISGTTGSRKRE